MIIVVKDANVIIDLIKLDLVEEFFQLPLEVHTTQPIIEDELYPDQKKLLQKEIYKGNLTIHEFTGKEIIVIRKIQNQNRSLSYYDCGAYYCAQKLDAGLLTSDKRLRNLAKRNKMEYHGHLWILDEMVNSGILKGSTAIDKLNQLDQINPQLGLPKQLCRKMKKKWQNE
jgi:hypothetical protein